jgi:hypothetical protein
MSDNESDIGANARTAASRLSNGGAAMWPLAARAQQPERKRRVGVLMSTAADDPEGRPHRRASGREQLGWTDGHNAQIEARWPHRAAVAAQHCRRGDPAGGLTDILARLLGPWLSVMHLKGGVLDWRERTDACTAASRFPIDLMDEMKLVN